MAASIQKKPPHPLLGSVNNPGGRPPHSTYLEVRCGLLAFTGLSTYLRSIPPSFASNRGRDKTRIELHQTPDEDGSMKIELNEEFADSEVYLGSIQAITAAKAKGQ